MPRPLEAPAIEIELTPAQMRLAVSTRDVAGFVCGRSQTGKQRSVYFDTRDRALRAAGMSLSVRPSGDGWVQTLTSEHDAPSAAPGRSEIEATVGSGKPDIAAIAGKATRHKLAEAAGEARLVPVFDVALTRTSRGLATEAGDEIELILDKGVVSSGKRKESFNRARVTLKTGNPSALVTLASSMAVGEAPELSSRSMADRGYRLADAQQGTPQGGAVKARPSPIDPDMTAGEAMSAICGAAVAHILQNWSAVLEGDDPEAVHQLRVGLRRLRSALRILRGAADEPGFGVIGEKGRDLGVSVGRLRDVDVLLSDIVTPLAGTSQVAKGISDLRRSLSSERAKLRGEVLDALATREASRFRIELAVLPYLVSHAGREDAKPLRQPVPRFAHKALRKLLERATKRGRRLDELSIEERHELRKAMKSLRYGIDFFAPLYPAGEIKHLLSAAADLQDVLGYLNDVALAEQLMTFPTPEAARSGGMAHAIGAVIGWHAAQAEHAWISAKSAWKRFHRETGLIA